MSWIFVNELFHTIEFIGDDPFMPRLTVRSKEIVSQVD